MPTLTKSPRILTATAIAAIAIVAAVVSCWYTPVRRGANRPIAELSSVRYVSAEDWAELVTGGQTAEPGRILLPTAPEGPDYRSGISAEARGLLKPEACRECHAETYASFMETAHARTSAFASAETIQGSFADAHKTLMTSNPDLWFVMQQDPDGFFQELHVRAGDQEHSLRRQFDLVLGSGNHGQSFAYWDSDRLYQLHASYLTELDQWVNSPGMYTDGTADFARPVTGRCLECHATWFAQARGSVNRFDKQDILTGVTCVRCHGRGDRHVALHRNAPATVADIAFSKTETIIHPANLSRDRLNDLCAQCHSSGDPHGPAFAYIPGTPLENYLTLELSGEDPANEDPHSANQLARLMKSTCFQEDAAMTCISCHDPHRHERGRTSEFSARCLKCHEKADCGERTRLGEVIDSRCVDCHMPSRRDAQVTVELKSTVVTALVRDHYIRVWPEVADKIRKEILANSASGHAATESRPKPVSEPTVKIPE